MQKNDVQIGGVYNAKVSDKLVQVRIDAENVHGGWDATNLTTGKKVRIKTAARLRDAAGAPEATTAADEHDPPASAQREVASDQATSGRNNKLTCLEAAARVLAESDEPLNAKQMIEAITAKGYWSSPAGKTPHATLYSAIVREIAVKGGDARFRKTGRGQFAANA